MRTPTIKTVRWAIFAVCLTAIYWPASPLFGDTPATVTAPRAKTKSPFELAYGNASPLANVIGRAADEAQDSATSGDLDAAKSQADAAFLLACAYGTDRDIDAFREAAFVRRLVHQIAMAQNDSRADLLAYLRAHPALAHTFVFAIKDRDNIINAYMLLDRLRKERPAQLERFSELATAICIVRNHPRHWFNEPGVQLADPLEVFDFYVSHERQMFYGLRGVPVELLIYVVDNPVSIDDMNWALNKYAGTRDIGSLFFTIEYDFDFFNGKARAKLETVPGGRTLPNILKVGGVCADQAYFATSVGKSIGIPSAWTDGNSAEAGHAWVGYLKSNGRSAAWDFDSGRYDDFQFVRGNVTDPQTGESLADSTVGLLSDLIGTSATQRQNAVALVDAARVWGAWGDANRTGDPPVFPPDVVTSKTARVPQPRMITAAGQLELVEMGLRQFADYPCGWAVVADLARDGKLSESQKHVWADLTQRMCGQKHVDFALSILDPMVETVADANEQSGLWDAIFKYVQSRSDLAADVRLRQARLWEKQDNLPRAGQCYEDVLQNYINTGPFALPALKGAESVLKKMGQESKVLELYAQTVKRVTKPEITSGRPEFIHESNWYKVRQAYADRLEAAGQKQLADEIRSEDEKG